MSGRDITPLSPGERVDAEFLAERNLDDYEYGSMAAVLARAMATIDAMSDALRLIRLQGGGDDGACENFTTGIGSCFEHDNRTADARYGADRACSPCIAHYALECRPIPLEPVVVAGSVIVSAGEVNASQATG